MYKIEEIIEFLETRKVPSSWSMPEDTDKKVLMGGAWNLMTWLYSDLFIPRGRPMRIHSPNDDGWRTKILIDSVPELNKLVKLENRILDFREEIPTEERLKIHEWVIKNYNPPPPKP